MDNPKECEVCFSVFSEEAGRRPRTLPCGHTFCSSCISDILDNGHLSCPGCRAQHTAPDATHFPINYGMEALIRQLECIAMRKELIKKVESEAPSEEEGLSEIHKGKIVKILAGELEEEKVKVADLLAACSRAQTQLEQYKAQVVGQRTHHLRILRKLCDLVEWNRKAIDQLQREDARVLQLEEEGNGDKWELQLALQRLDNAIATEGEALTCATATIMSTQEWIQKCEDLHQTDQNRPLSVSQKVLEDSRRTLLEVASPEVDNAADPPNTSDVMRRIEEIGRSAPERTISFLTFDHIRSMRPEVVRLLQEGRVFAVHVETIYRCSMVTLERGLLHLHSLRAQNVPSHAHTLQVTSYLATPLPTILVFMDIAWGDQTRGRVYIRLNLDTPLARQFLMLCTGQNGYTYCNTSFLKVCGRHIQGEFILGGDYEKNDGTGGAPILPDLHGDYWRTGQAGSVWGRWEVGDQRAAQFAITTKNCQGIIPRVFGKVESGMEVLRSLVLSMKARPLVADCGAVLNL